MDLEELKVIISASVEGFENSILKIKEQLGGLNKEVDKVNDSIATKLNNSKINPKIDIESMKKQIDDLTNKIGNKANGVADKVKSQTKGALDSLVSETDTAISKVIDRVKNIKMPTFNFPRIDSIKPNSNDSASQTTTRGPPKTKSIDTESLKSEITNVTATLDNINERIEREQTKLSQLKEAFQNAFNPVVKDRIQDQILKTEASINSLISKSDKLGFKLADLDAKLASVGNAGKSGLSESLKSVGKGAEGAASKFNLLGKFTGFFGNMAKSTANTGKKLSEAIKDMGSSCKSTNNHMSNMHNGLGNIARQFATWMIILPLVMKGIEGMTSGLLADLKTNEQFNNSLNQIKTNLMVAFTPIFYAILPAINSLMSALATATTYIASFISAIFGKTYQQSFQATQGLIDAKKAMGAYGDSAKKAAKDSLGLAGFDEINNLSKNKGAEDNSKVPTLTQPSIDTSQVDFKMKALADKFKEILGKIFDPMKQAWDQEGKATMDALKYALSSIWDLAKDIGKTFLDVWSNGTGLKICTDILKLLQTIFGIIGDIAKAFKIAWDTGGLGKALVQAIFNALDSVLKLLNTIGQVFREVWNSGIGVQICTNILEILKNIFTIIGQVADSFNRAFQSDAGKQLITDILNLLNGCLRNIKDITSSFSKAWETNGDTIVKGILLILDDIVGTISDIANKWSNAWENNGAGDTLMNSLLSTLGKILTTVGDIGQGIRESIGKAADTIFPAMIQFATDVSNGLGSMADGFKSIWDNGGKTLFDGIVQLIAQVGQLILQITGGAFKDFGNLFRDVLAPAIGKAADILGTVVGWLADLVGKINENKPLVEGIKDAFEGWALAVAGVKLGELGLDLLKVGSVLKNIGIISTLGEIIAGIVTAIGGWPILIAAAIIGVGIAIYTHWDEIKAKTAEIWNGIKDFFSQWGTDILALFIGGPIALVAVEVAKHWDEISAKTSEIWNSVKDYLGQKWDELKTDASTKFEEIKTYIGQKWDNTKTDAETKWENIKTTLSQKWEKIKTDSQTTWDNLKEYVSKKWDDVNTDASTKWKTIKTSLGTKWGEVTKSSSDTWDGIKKYIGDKWTEVNNDAPGLWDKIRTTLGTAWNSISTDSQGVWNGIVNFLNTTFSTDWGKAWNGLANLVDDAFKGLEGMVKKPINAIIDMANYLIEKLNTIKIDIPDWVPEVGGDSFSIGIPKIPKLATGGIIDSPTLAMVGEAGKEAVMPLENNTGWIDQLAGQIASKIGGNSNSVSTSSGDSGDVIFLLDGEVLGKVAITQLRKMKKQGVNLADII